MTEMTRAERSLAATALFDYADHMRRRARRRDNAGPTWAEYRQTLRRIADQAEALGRAIDDD